MDQLTLVFVAAVIVVVAVSAIASRIGVAAPILLVVVGVGLSLIPGVPTVVMPPEVILTIVLPLLLYAAAVNMPATDFRRNLGAISALSVFLVVASAFAVGLVLWWLVPGLGLAGAVAVGAVVSPPDAVAATSIGKRLGLPPRLVTILEGEGLLNDATALVMLRSAIVATAGAISFGSVLVDFAYAVGIAVLIGAVVGVVSVTVRSILHQPVTSTAISFVVPFIAFVPAEHVGASGVLAVVVAGIVTGVKAPKKLSSQDRVTERTNWRTVLLLLENGVFLLMGLQIASILGEVRDARLSVSTALWLGVLVTVVLAVVRTGFVIPMIGVMKRQQRRAHAHAQWLDQAFDRLEQHHDESRRSEPLHDEDGKRMERIRRMLTRKQADTTFFINEGIGTRGGLVLAWSGMRGVVTVAAAQTLPADLAFRPQLILTAFMVALLTLVLQGGSLPWLIRVLGIRGTDREELQRELTSLLNELGAASTDLLDSDTLTRSDGSRFDPELVAGTKQRIRPMPEDTSTDTLMQWNTALQQRRELHRKLLEAQQDALLDAQASGVYRSETIAAAQRVIDNRAIMFED